MAPKIFIFSTAMGAKPSFYMKLIAIPKPPKKLTIFNFNFNFILLCCILTEIKKLLKRIHSHQYYKLKNWQDNNVTFGHLLFCKVRMSTPTKGEQIGVR